MYLEEHMALHTLSPTAMLAEEGAAVAQIQYWASHNKSPKSNDKLQR